MKSFVFAVDNPTRFARFSSMNYSLSSWPLLTVIFCIASATVEAQTVIGVPREAISLVTGSYASGVSTPRPVQPLSSIASALTRSGPLWQRGPLAARPHFNYEVVHGTGILRIPGQPEKTTMHTVSPGILVNVGTQASMDYTLSRVMFSNENLEDETDHNFRVQGGLTRDNWKFGLSGEYGTVTNVLAETGGQTRDESYTTTGTVSYQLGQRSELEVLFNHTDRTTRPSASSPTWQGSDWVLWNVSTWLRRHLSKELNIAAGVAAGYDEIGDAPDMSHIQPQLQINWRPTQKISLSAEVARENRRVRSTRPRNQENTRYNASVSYRPFSTTSLSVGAIRAVEPSYFTRETTQSRSWNVRFEQRFLTRLFFSISNWQSKEKYDSTTTALVASPNRFDRSETINVKLSTPIFGKGSVAVFHQRTYNRSSETIYNFTSDQVGGQFTYQF
jgi:hypothetical protein